MKTDFANQIQSHDRQDFILYAAKRKMLKGLSPKGKYMLI